MKQLLWVSMVCIFAITACKKDKPATTAILTTTTVSNITANTAQTGGNITSNGGGAISQTGVCWSIHSGPTVGDSIISGGATAGSFSISLSRLYANSTYYVRAYAINSVGTAYGNELIFTTAKGLASVTTTAVSNILPLVATSGGNVVSDGGDAITARGLCYSASPHPTTSNFTTSDSTGTGIFIDSLRPLASQTVYYVRAYAINSYGTAYGNEISFTASSANSVTDFDGNVYGYIKIGTQMWMTSNLKVTHYQNGDPIANGLTGYDWTANNGNGTVGAYTFPNKDSTKKNQFGLYYNYAAAVDSRKVAPVGWHIPTDVEWQTLEYYLGMSISDTALLGYRGSIGSNLQVGGSSGLNLQLAGYLSTFNPTYNSFGVNGYYATSRVLTNLNGNQLYIRIFSGPQSANYLKIGRNTTYNLTSIRCIKD